MRHSGERRSHVLPPSRKGRRQSLAAFIKNEPARPDADTDLELLLALPAQARRDVLDNLKTRSLS